MPGILFFDTFDPGEGDTRAEFGLPEPPAIAPAPTVEPAPALV